MNRLSRAFSIDHYSVIDDEDDDEFSSSEEGDQFLEDPYHSNNAMAASPASVYKKPTFSYWTVIAIIIGVAIVLGSLVAAAAIMTRRNNSTTDRSGSGKVCSSSIDGDPIMALRSTASAEGLQNGAVAADHPVCSQIGIDIMRDRGGNAVDAAVAVALCLGVANPASSGIGGGAFILIHTDPPVKKKNNKNQSSSGMPLFHDQRTVSNENGSPLSATGKITEVIDCREVAPSASDEDMFNDDVTDNGDDNGGAASSSSLNGGLAIGVPGELRGLELAHRRHGKLPWAVVVDPAIELARSGVRVNMNLAYEIAEKTSRMRQGTDYSVPFRAVLTKDDNWKHPLKEGDLMKNTKLADTLQAVRDGGADALYTGKLAEQLARDIQDAGGIITKQDLESYRPTLRSPVVSHDVNGFSIVGCPPPSSGGAAIIGAARFLAGYDNPFSAFSDTLSVHRLVESLKHAFGIRMSLGDPAYNTDVVDDAVKDLVEGSYMESLRVATKDNGTIPLSKYGGPKWAQLMDTDGDEVPEDAQEGDRRRVRARRRLMQPYGYLNDHGTSHFSIIDKDGNSVSMTSSVNTYFGSKVMSKATGIVLNNVMDDFAYPAQTQNYFGLKPSPSNYIEPGKKPLSSMSPTMVFRRSKNADGTDALGDLTLSLGASGGPKIISAVLQVFVNHVLMGWPLFESIVHPRIHDQLVYHGAAATTTEEAHTRTNEPITLSRRTFDALKVRGHQPFPIDYLGTVQGVSIDQETKQLTAVCDVRKGGSPAGY